MLLLPSSRSIVFSFSLYLSVPFEEQTSGADTVRFEKDIISMKHLQIDKPMHTKLENVMWPNLVLEGSGVCRMEEEADYVVLGAL